MFNDIIDKNCKEFINAVKMFADSNQTKPQHSKSGGFPIFYSQNSKYYEQTFLDKTIENFVWFYLINSTLKELFENNCGIKKVNISWPKINRQLTTSVVDDIEKIYPFEFFITDSVRIGYRYTDCSYSEDRLDKIFESNNVDQAVILDFSSKSISTFLFEPMFPPKYKNRITIVPFNAFFEEYFGKDAFETYKRKMTEVIETAYNYVGIESISNLSVQHLPFFIDDMLDKILQISFDKSEYTIIGDQSELKKYQLDNLNAPENIITVNDYSVMNHLFFENGRYMAIAGKANFAKSIITSEYLYQTLRKNNVFDYTAIVSGYLKSIEQLLYELMLFRLEHNDDVNELYIKKNSKKIPKCKEDEVIRIRGIYHIRFEKENVKYFDITFAPMVNFLNDDINGWKISEGAKILITTYLGIYCDECRNEHFHKDNINSIKEVETIRSNTLLLIYYILGGYKLFDDINLDGKLLKIADRRFDRMYRELHKNSIGDFYKIGFNDEKMILVALPSKQKEVQYDNDGILKEKVIRFVKVEKVLRGDELRAAWLEIENDTDSNNVIFVTPENCITRLISINTLTEEETEIFW